MEYDLIQSIPGIDTKITATILAEIGKIDRFDHAKKLIAFAGIDPSVLTASLWAILCGDGPFYQNGKFA